MDSLLIRLASVLFLLWAAAAVVAVIATFTLTAHRDLLQESESSPPLVAAGPTGEPSRPSAVPDDADLITEDTELGAVSPGASAGPAHIFYWLTCEDQLLTIATTQETIYAEVDCARYWLVHEVVRPYQGQSVEVEITTGESAILVLYAATAGPARFDVDTVWVQPR